MAIDQRWGLNHLKLQTVLFMAVLSFSDQDPSFGWCLNSEGLALLKFRERIESDPFGALSNWNEEDVDPCSWSGVECSDGKIVTLDFRDLCLRGTLAPEIRKLLHLKSAILRNNSFSGYIPREVAALQELQLLDLGYNNLTGPIPSEFNLSFTTVLLDKNQFFGSISEKRYGLKTRSEFSGGENTETNANAASWGASWDIRCPWEKKSEQKDIANRRLLQLKPPPGQSGAGLQTSPPPPFRTLSVTPPKPPEPTPSPPDVQVAQPPLPPPPSSAFPAVPQNDPPPPAPPPPPQYRVSNPPPNKESDRKSSQLVLIISVVSGSVLVVGVAVTGVILLKNKKIRPWATGISGLLQRAFVTGVPKLKRSDLEVACEDFSNILGSVSGGTVYKGTLSSGVEIAVISTSVKSCEEWSENLEAQFRKKIETLSKVNHKNFLNLIGYCEEDKPFTRMMVFEYAPNGTLFEHLHMQEAERLDWGTRLRIAGGIAYCLEEMHQLSPPILLKNLKSGSVYLTEDNAAKVVDFTYQNDGAASCSIELQEHPTLSDPPSNIHSFGIVLYEILTGRIPNSAECGSLADLLSVYLRREKPLREVADPTLESFQEDVLERLIQVIQACVNPDPSQRPTMREVSTRLKEVTGMGPNAAMPRLSPAWWAELEILSEAA